MPQSWQGDPAKEKRDKEEELEKNRNVRAARVAAINKAKKAERDAAAEKSRLAKAWGGVSLRKKPESKTGILLSRTMPVS